MKAEIEAPSTFNAHGVAEELRNKLSQERGARACAHPPCRRRTQGGASGRTRSICRRLRSTRPTCGMLAAAGGAVIPPGARSQRTYAAAGERILPTRSLLAAALEGPPELSGLTAEMRADVEQAYVKAHHGQSSGQWKTRRRRSTWSALRPRSPPWKSGTLSACRLTSSTSGSRLQPMVTKRAPLHLEYAEAARRPLSRAKSAPSRPSIVGPRLTRRSVRRG